MEVKVDSRGRTTTVYVSGRIDKLGADKFQQTLDQVVSGKPQEVVFDFGGVNFIGSSGIGKLLIFGREITSQDGRVKIVNPSQEIKALFTSAKLDKLFNI